MSAVRALALRDHSTSWSPADRLRWLAALQSSLATSTPKKRPSGQTLLAVATALATLAVDGSGRVWAGQAKLRSRSLLGRTALRSGLRALEGEGWIDIQERFMPGREHDTDMITLQYPPPGSHGDPGGSPDGATWAVARSKVGRQTTPKEESKDIEKVARAMAWAKGLSAQDWYAAKSAHSRGRGPWQVAAWETAGCPETGDAI